LNRWSRLTRPSFQACRTRWPMR